MPSKTKFKKKKLPDRFVELIQFLKDLSEMLTEHGLSYPSLWEQVKPKYRAEFKSWVENYKCQTWEDNWRRAWEIYQLDFFQFLIYNITGGQTNCHEEAESNAD